MLSFKIEKSKTWGKREDNRYFAVVRFQDESKKPIPDGEDILKATLSYDLMAIYPESQNSEEAFDAFCSEFTSEGVSIYKVSVKDLCDHDGYIINKCNKIIQSLEIASYANEKDTLIARKQQIENRISKGVYSWIDDVELRKKEQLICGSPSEAFTINYFMPHYHGGILEAASDKNFCVYHAAFDHRGYYVNSISSVAIPHNAENTILGMRDVICNWQLVNVTIEELTNGKYFLLERSFALKEDRRGNLIGFDSINDGKMDCLVNLCTLFHDAFHLGELDDYDSTIALNCNMSPIKEVHLAYPIGNDNKIMLLDSIRSAISYGVSKGYIKGITKSTFDEEERIRIDEEMKEKEEDEVAYWNYHENSYNSFYDSVGGEPEALWSLDDDPMG